VGIKTEARGALGRFGNLKSEAHVPLPLNL